MSNLNKAQLIGRLTRDPEMRYTSTGTAICKFGLATNRFSKSSEGESKEQVDFHNVTCFDSQYRKLAEMAAAYLHKGSLVYVEGRIQYHSWEGDDGVKRSATEIVANDIQFLTPKSEATQAPTATVGRTGSAVVDTEIEDPALTIDPDDIPF